MHGQRNVKLYSESVFVALGIQHAKQLRHIVICGLHVSIIFFPHLISGAVFGKKLLNMKCVLMFSTAFI